MTRRIYKPMLAKATSTAFTDKDWIFEIKWDGFRAIAYVEEPFSLKSRNGKELKNIFPELIEINQLAHNIVVDGEIIVMQNGKPDFQTLLKRGQTAPTEQNQRSAKRAPAIYIIFDILEKDGQALTKLPLMERKKILTRSLKEGSNVILSDFIEEKGETYYQLSIAKGLEGVIAKRKSSLYEENLHTGSWLKIKRLKTCDCIIFGYTQGSKSREATFGALLLGVYDPEGKPIYLGKVGSGFSQQMLMLLSAKFEKIKTDFVPFEPEAGDIVVWLEPKIVCEVIYQVLTSDTKLRMARFQRLREDKFPAECTIDQLTEEKTMSMQTERLFEYAAKRNFEKTPEPKGGGKKSEALLYVIHEHHARRLHWDLRLEKDGVLKSWAVPKGIPEVPKIRHLAVETEDHPYEYGRFEGIIPKGQYGAGIVKIWDKGHYIPKAWEQDKIEVKLDGDRLHGNYVLVRLKKSEEQKNWLLLKGKDPPGNS
ncbi:MAG: non-homologous end-joining DNA ligase [Nitrososphaerota archaeon]|jgi:DNA ligase D-like protein (predicted ligase)/DNA ligase D-like protein (predicted 3'-phosphoesterase)|nr:non-homologous end-joining DNA ligase [Nitrososphaerota archaeon]